MPMLLRRKKTTSATSKNDGEGDGHHLKLRNAQALDDEESAQLVKEGDALGPRAEDQENEVLEKIGERE